MPVIEVTHGDGLGGSSFNYGFSKTPEQELIKLAAETAKHAKIAFLMLPGVGTKEDIKEAQNNGGSICRIATHCTEADVSIQHFGLARELGLETVGFLMMSHTHPAGGAGRSRRGSWPTPAASASTSSTRRVRWSSRVSPTGWRRWSPSSATTPRSASTATRTSASACANSVEAVRAGAKQIDGSCRRFGAGAGNAPVEAFIGVFDKLGVKTGIDFFDIADAAEDVVAPAMPAECLLDRKALIMGYAGVYSSFLKHAIRQSERYGVPGPSAAAPGRPAQADRWPGGPAHRHRAGDQAGARGRTREVTTRPAVFKLVGPARHHRAMATRDDAQAILEQLAGPTARLRDDQWTAIEALVVQRRRALVVQRTGWGKSAVYFIAAKLLRAAGHGATVIVSPLLALMRNQVAAAERAGVHAATINSSNVADWDEIHERVRDGELDVLLVSPERLNNPDFRDKVLPALAATPAWWWWTRRTACPTGATTSGLTTGGSAR